MPSKFENWNSLGRLQSQIPESPKKSTPPETLKNMLSFLRTTARTTLSHRTPIIASARSYHDNVIDHYERPRNVGSLDKKSTRVGTGLVGAPACGDVMKLDIEVDENGVIVQSKFKTFGCGSAIASSSVATEWVKGKTIDEAVEITNKDIAAHLKLPPVKLHCSMLAEDAIRAAVKDFKAKNDA